ncbi:unnamed protein product [Eruca vesicaria subsp. sativa]|uniref:Uncharacterized protein n=1 Tax=Eruca vesicaria subsp. sativa TaxID=29727 RepID=A0ABC8IQC2_ERUVS|nr:unnamed protein product [Eruca vesicaria subsp. sativa]
MSKEIDVPVLSLDDDLMVDKDYKLFFDHLSDKVTPFEDDSGESEIRKLNLNMFSSDSNRSKRKIAELEDESLWDVPLYRTLEVIKRDNEARKLAESMVEDTSWDVPLVRAQEVIQRGSKARKVSESTEVDTLWDVPLVKAQEVIQRDNKARKFIESKVDTLRDVPLVRTKEVIQRDNKMSELRKKRDKAAETSKVVPVKRVHRVTETKAVDETRKKSVEESVDKDYMSYLTWLVDSSKSPPEKDLLEKVKVELESCSDDDDIIEVSDTPFTDGETTPFVVSKSKTVIDLEDDSTEDESGDSCVFRRELMDVLEKPFDEGELLLLSGQASMKKRVSRCRELRKGRESSYETSELGLSYLEKVCDFDKEYKLVEGDDKARLELLRGFFFYLENICLPGAFKPWLPENGKKLGQR